MATEKYGRPHCGVEGCDRAGKMVRGLCLMHYSRHRRIGSLEPLAPLSKLCTTGDCLCKATRKGLCEKHYKAWERTTEDGKLRHLASNRRYIAANREKVRSYNRARRSSCPDYRMACWMRSNLRKVLDRANKRKDARCVDMMGYGQHELRSHIERQFQRGMSWDNHGEWHIDHIIPVAEHLRRGETDPMVINALPNLRPMWSKDNIRKSAQVQTLL